MWTAVTSRVFTNRTPFFSLRHPHLTQPPLKFDDGTADLGTLNPPRMVTGQPIPMAFTALFPNGVPCDNSSKFLFWQWARQAGLSTPWDNVTDNFVAPFSRDDVWSHKYVPGVQIYGHYMVRKRP